MNMIKKPVDLIPKTCLNRLWFSFNVMVSILMRELNMYSMFNEVDLRIFVCLKR